MKVEVNVLLSMAVRTALQRQVEERAARKAVNKSAAAINAHRIAVESLAAWDLAVADAAAIDRSERAIEHAKRLTEKDEPSVPQEWTTERKRQEVALYRPLTYKPEEYRALALWGRQLGSYSYYIKGEQEKAARMGAPIDALYERDGVWTRVAHLKADHPFRAAYLKESQEVEFMRKRHASDPSAVEERDGRWYIVMGRPGYNCRQNNASGWTTREAAEAAARVFAQRSKKMADARAKAA